MSYSISYSMSYSYYPYNLFLNRQTKNRKIDSSSYMLVCMSSYSQQISTL